MLRSASAARCAIQYHTARTALTRCSRMRRRAQSISYYCTCARELDVEAQRQPYHRTFAHQLLHTLPRMTPALQLCNGIQTTLYHIRSDAALASGADHSAHCLARRVKLFSIVETSTALLQTFLVRHAPARATTRFTITARTSHRQDVQTNF